MSRRVVIALLQQVRWHPPGVDPAAWRAALAEDVVDVIATLSEVDAAIAVPVGDRGLAEAVRWPDMPVYEVSTATLGPVLIQAQADGYDQAVVLAPDAPDVPGLIIGKLIRPLTTRAVAVAPAGGDRSGGDRSSGVSSKGDRSGRVPPGGRSDGESSGGDLSGLLGVACRLPFPDWLAGLDLDSATAAGVRAAAPDPGDVAVTAGWRRLRVPATLTTLDPALEGWEATRALLSP